MSILFLFILALVVAFVMPIPRQSKWGRASGAIVSHSGAANAAHGYSTCGGCHGTGQEGLGLADWGECTMCDGRGYFKIDPNAKTMTLAEAMEWAEKQKGQR